MNDYGEELRRQDGREEVEENAERCALLNARLRQTLPGVLGVAIVAVTHGILRAVLTLDRRHLAANGYLHAGAVITLADTACGFGCYSNLPEGAINYTTIELKSNFLRTVTEGVIEGEARLVHGGRRTQVWDATVVDSDRRVLALFRCTQLILYSPQNSHG